MPDFQIRPLCQHNGTLDPFGRCNGCGAMVPDPELELMLDMVSMTALRDWADRKKARTDLLDRPLMAPCGTVLDLQVEDDLFMELVNPASAADLARAPRVRYFLSAKGDLAGYPWRQHAQLPGEAA